MARYLRGEHHPQKALGPRVMFLAEAPASAEGVGSPAANPQPHPIGYIGGHRTERYGCDGELQYLYVSPAARRGGVASEMLRRMAEWFEAQGAARICVDVEPGNARPRAFYRKHGAVDLNPHWLVWEELSPW
jgi:GNAT superfamily N-acetyltransferase